MHSILICKIEQSSVGPRRFYGQTESGKVFPGVIGHADGNGDRCFMEVFPVSGLGDMPINEVLENWSFGKSPKRLIEVSVWGSDEIEPHLPKAADRWFIVVPDKPKKLQKRKALNVSGLSEADKASLQNIANTLGYENNVSSMIRAISRGELIVSHASSQSIIERLEKRISRLESLIDEE